MRLSDCNMIFPPGGRFGRGAGFCGFAAPLRGLFQGRLHAVGWVPGTAPKNGWERGFFKGMRARTSKHSFCRINLLLTARSEL